MFHIQPLFRSLAEQLQDAVGAEPDAAGWTDAVLDVRYSLDGRRRLKKIRANAGGRLVSVSVLYGDIDQLAEQIWAARGGEAFYGFAMAVSASGEVDVRLNYDPGCYTDPGFFET